MTPRFYCPDLAQATPYAGGTYTLPANVAHHAERVLRLRAGDALTVFDGQGTAWHGSLLSAGKSCVMHFLVEEKVLREAPLAITLVQALAVGDKMDWVVQKAVELGAAGIQPISAERSVLRLSGERAEKRVAHWQQIAIGASEQCGRQVIVPVRPILRLVDWLAQPCEGARWILDHEEGTSLSALPAPSGPVSLMIGPEGGWSAAELAAAHTSGASRVKMGPRVLRTETAGLAGKTLKQQVGINIPCVVGKGHMRDGFGVQDRHNLAGRIQRNWDQFHPCGIGLKYCGVFGFGDDHHAARAQHPSRAVEIRRRGHG